MREMNDIAYKLADAFWPGALTLVLPRLEKDKLSKAGQCRAGYGGVRVFRPWRRAGICCG